MAIGIAMTINGTPEDALAQEATVVVAERMGATTEWRVTLPVDIGDGDLPRLVDPRFDPGSEMAIYADVGGTIECLAKGPVRGQRIRLVHGGAGSQVEVIGGDGGLLMDREAKVAQWADVTDSDAVTTIVSAYGFTPDVTTTSARHEEARRTLLQRGTDLEFVRMLARRNGMLFWISADAAGVQTAHFKAPAVDGEPQVTLTINLADATLDALEIAWDVETPNAVVAQQVDALSKQVLDGSRGDSPLPALAQQALAALAGAPRSALLATPAEDGGDLGARAGAALVDAGFFLTTTVSASKERLGALLRPPQLVALQGVGSRHSGSYLVASVTHTIDDAVHRMDAELVRNAWGAANA